MTTTPHTDLHGKRVLVALTDGTTTEEGRQRFQEKYGTTP